jgi:hypothetical protein
MMRNIPGFDDVFRFPPLLSLRRPAGIPPQPLLHASDETARDYRVLAIGLAAVLARCPADLVQRHFPVSAAALGLLRRQFRTALREASLPAGMLNDLAHEIAQCADEETRAAARRCLDRAVTARRAHAGAMLLAPSH